MSLLCRIKLFKVNSNFDRYIKCFSTAKRFDQLSKPILRSKSRTQEIGPFGWFLLIIPVSTFGLGTWQVQRKKWKENLLAQLKEKTSKDPVALPENLELISELEYCPVRVRGKFLHEKEMYMGPRSLLEQGDASTESSLISKGQKNNQGYLVITPFKLADRDETILVNRGWVPLRNKDPKTRINGQIEGNTDLIGIVRLQENRPPFMPANKDSAWFYRDLNRMAEISGSSPLFLDATRDFEVPGGPIGGQTRISLRNEHLSYIMTWYSLSLITSFSWYAHFLKPK